MEIDIDKLTDAELDQLVQSEELKCKIEPKTGELKCATTEEISRAIARLRNPPKKLIFEVAVETAPPGVTEE